MKVIHNISTGNFGTLCASESYKSLKVPINIDRYDSARQKADLAALVLQEIGIGRHGTLLDAVCKGLLSDPQIISSRIISANTSNESSVGLVWWRKNLDESGALEQVEENLINIDLKSHQRHPWMETARIPFLLRPPRNHIPKPPNNNPQRGTWTFPYFSCSQKQWILSYNVEIPPQGRHR